MALNQVHASAAVSNNLNKLHDRHERSGIADQWNVGENSNVTDQTVRMHSLVFAFVVNRFVCN